MTNEIALKSDVALGLMPMDINEMMADAELGGKVSLADISIPYIYALQSNSPQVNPDSEKFIEGATPGMLLVTSLDSVFDGRKIGLPIVPCYFEAKINEWIPREQGGGLVNSYEPDSNIMDGAKPNDKGIPCLPNGHLLVQTAYHYVLFKNPLTGNWTQAIIPMKSTGLKKSRKLNSVINTTFIPGTTKKAPRFLYTWNLTTVKEQKDVNIWSNLEFTQLDMVNAEAYAAAKQYAIVAAKGILRKATDESKHADADPVGITENDAIIM